MFKFVVFFNLKLKIMKNIIRISIVFLFTFFAAQSFAQSTDAYGKTVDKSRGASYTLPTTDVEAPKPDTKRGECCINFDNYTGYTIYVWVDNVYRGTVSPWGDGEVCVGSGWTTYYARTAGSTYEWENSGDCRSSFNLKLR
jgi:hypothetical protein